MIHNFHTFFLRWGLFWRGLAGILFWVGISQATASAQTGSVTLGWQADPDSSVVGYRLYYGASSGTLSQTIDVGNATTATIPNLAAGVTYYFVVTAYNDLGLQSPPSNQASFTAPVAATAGTYCGLVTNSSPSASNTGSVRFTLQASGKFSAQAKVGASTFTFSGTFNSSGVATASVTPKGEAPVVLSLQLEPSTGEITGSITQGATLFSSIFAVVAPYSKTNAAPQAGAYTVLFEPSTETNTTGSAPQGYGYGRLLVSATGAVTFSGRLGDSTAFSFSSVVDGNGTCPIFVSLYSHKGFLAGTITFESITTAGSESDFDGSMEWSDPSSNGFSTAITMVGSAYTAPSVTANDLLTGVHTQETVTLANGDLPNSIVKDVTIAPNGAVTVENVAADKLAMRLSAATGLFSGSFADGSPKIRRVLYGAVFQKRGIGAGVFNTPSGTGSVTLAEN